MARLIFISPYLKGGKNTKWLKNRTHYFATREGVVLPVTAKDAPPTKKQVEYIRRLTKNLPLCRELLEYEDYKVKPSACKTSLTYKRAQGLRLSSAAYQSHCG